MTIYSFWIFDKHCNCIYDREWTLLANPKSGTTNSKQNDDISKLLYGIIFSLRSVTGKLSSTETGRTNEISSISTGRFRIHTYCTATGLWFVLLTDFKPFNYSKVLQHIYSDIFVKYITNNYLSPYDFAQSEGEKRGQGTRKITNRHFKNNLELFLEPMISS
ncbi:similar to Saccharomyces cerevisiae YML077W BET5 Component of the TRAPP (transport protein particle) complex [Maudiozyma saulgeensis]|uniref:Trafficking protein particle complex subunit n=1 Tax=Maudiozyma saulgeensis TaxID=1789683 RepID=A0A1X7R0G6_9SACH|nr:similar to Saccharomyces cerevisiae YML077W BET5 Component of the TRAPP (transport protein particle) complex [Kazachstania saulgeensis]